MINKDHFAFAYETNKIEFWSEGFFNIDSEGYITLGENASKNNKIRLEDIILTAKQKNLSLPLLIRFPDILQKRLQQLKDAFNKAFIRNNYQGKYLPAYPIKVNQQRSVLNGLINHGSGKQDHLALEAGSKPELFAVIALAARHNLEIICNGYKDRDYIKLALLANKMGLTITIIIEKLSELSLVLAISKELNTTPRLGVRVKLASLGKGNWQNSCGVKSKFGLTSLQLLFFLEQLKASNNLDKLKVLHFHLGSQIADLSDIQSGLQEGARLYAEISKLGADLEAIDVGGGLGVDYEGTCSRSYCSINYNLDLYANVVVKTILDICQQEELPHPKIITESGRSMVAHHAVLVTNIIDVEPIISDRLPTNYPQADYSSRAYVELTNCMLDLEKDRRRSIEVYHQAKLNFNLAQDLYINGHIHLHERAEVEQLYYKICIKLLKLLDPKIHNHRKILDILNEDMANKIFCNFSLFQSLPDIWGIEQIFPIMPLSKLEMVDHSNNIRGLIQDMTCDSDGRIDKYIDGQGVESSLPLPKFDYKNPYNIGFFMVGAYQEILGDLHNLFGDTAMVDVVVSNDGFNITNCANGNSIYDVLKSVDYDANELLSDILTRADLNNTDYKTLDEFLSGFINRTPYYII